MKLVIWDIDGRLVDSRAAIMAAMRAGTDAAGLPPLTPAAVSRVVGLSAELHAAGARAVADDFAALGPLIEEVCA